ncbi:MAG TPA: pyruvate, phosphate dikinase [Verrucomicrobiae bacterium]|jgi:pyruvate,orthophosphate dikinase|nr:pyruvate, phosphate dikinase [Verrucomicrobiae bacterium]
MSTLAKSEPVTSRTSATQYVFFFGGGNAEGNGKMKGELGGKGAGLAEMTNAGLPVPPGFTIQTEACRQYLKNNSVPAELEDEMQAALARLEKLTGEKLGDKDQPLLVSVRSGSKFSMPGMMDTILNLGLTDQTVDGLARRTRNPEFAYECYRRLIQMFSTVVLEIPREQFTHAESEEPETKDGVDRLKKIIARFKKLIREKTGKDFPQDARTQLVMARDAVFRSWNNARARHYRRIADIPDDLGTAVNVQKMVFGNMGETSATGVGFTRNPATGANEFYGEFLPDAQGEDVVAGIRTPRPLAELKDLMPPVYDELRRATSLLEKHYRDVQDFEFTVEVNKLYLLQTRNGKRGGRAAVKIALDMIDEGLINKEEAIFRVEPNQLYDFLVPNLDESSGDAVVLTKGLPASPGAAVGQISFTAEDAVAMAGPRRDHAVILVRAETTPEDIAGMEVAAGILTSRGGMTSHAAVVTRGMGKCCVAGAGELEINEKTQEMRIHGRVLRRGDWLSLDGNTGRVILGKLPTSAASPDDPLLQKFMTLAEPFRRMRVRANADIPRDAIQARAFGAEGIGLCRTEHMFFAEDRIEHMREMILANDEPSRRKALDNLLPMQREDFLGLFKAMDGLPVTIRLLDPPLHEFLPNRTELEERIAELERNKASAKEIEQAKAILQRAESLHELNPMLGHRGCRLGITYPEISEMQARAICEAAVLAKKAGIKAIPEIMIPLVGLAKEYTNQEAIVRRIAEEVFEKAGVRVDYLVGTMIELPRACLVAADIAGQAEFFSFGSNDLTQTTFGFSRDDASKFLPDYLERGILKQDPFAVLDREGVGELVKMAIERGRKARPKLKIGVCGEHGGDPSSVQFLNGVGLDYVSCSPYRVLTARLAAAQAAAAAARGGEAGSTR